MSANPDLRKENFTNRFNAKRRRKELRTIDGSRSEPKLDLPVDLRPTKPVERVRTRPSVAGALEALRHDVPAQHEIGAWIKDAHAKAVPTYDAGL